jgi:predicted DNA-binding transcriptional regulator AlpA
MNILLTFPDLCRLLQANERIVLSLIEEGSVLPPVRIGNRLVRWAKGDLIRWLRVGCPKFPPLTPEELSLILAEYPDAKREVATDTDA